MEKLFNVSSSPHVRDRSTTQNLMFDVVIAMIPASVYGVWQFGLNALLVLIATVVSCVLSEYAYEKPAHHYRRQRCGNGYDPGSQHAA